MKTVAILLVLLLILLIPVTAQLQYEDKFYLDLKYLFLKKRILPKPPKDQKKAEKKTEKTVTADKPKRKFPLSAGEVIQLVPKAVELLIPPVRKLLKRTTAANFELDLVLVGSDAADTAMKFGEANAAVVYAVALLDRIVTLKTKRVNIYPGFDFEKSDVRAKADIRAYPLAVIIAAIQLAVAALRLLIPPLMQKKKNKANTATINNDDRKDDPNGKEKPAGRSA